MVLWNVVGQAVRYGAKGAAAFAQSDTGKRLKNAVEPPALVGSDEALIASKARILGGLLASLDHEDERATLLEGARGYLNTAERKVKRWANGSSIVLDREVAVAIFNTMPFVVEVVGSSEFSTPSLAKRAADVLREAPHVLAVIARFDADPHSGMRFTGALQAHDEVLAGQILRDVSASLFPFSGK